MVYHSINIIHLQLYWLKNSNLSKKDIDTYKQVMNKLWTYWNFAKNDWKWCFNLYWICQELMKSWVFCVQKWKKIIEYWWLLQVFELKEKVKILPVWWLKNPKCVSFEPKCVSFEIDESSKIKNNRIFDKL